MIDRSGLWSNAPVEREHRSTGGSHRDEPMPAIRGVVRWRLIDLCQWLWESSASLSHGRRWSWSRHPGLPQAHRPQIPRHHARLQSNEHLKKFPAILAATAGQGVKPAAIEIWFADEARIGQKWEQDHPSLGQTRERGQRRRPISAPLPPHLRSHLVLHLARVQLVLLLRNTEAMNLHLAEIATAVAPGCHAALLVDQADGTCRTSSRYRPTSRSCHCRAKSPNSTL